MNRSFFTVIAAAVLTLNAAPAFSADPSPLAGGKALYEKTCAACHAERSLARMRTRRVGGHIKKMVANEAQLDESQSGLILGYLTAKSAFETKCNTCHDLQKPLASIKDAGQWKSTVQRMAAMKSGHLADADAGAITLYLSLVAPVKPAAPAAPAAPGYK
jgi:cytochrome c5